MNAGPPLAIVITALRRSATTALLQTIARRADASAFDEPFHPRLWKNARENSKGTWTDLTALWTTGPEELAPGARPIYPLDELDPGVSPGQVALLKALTRRDPTVIIDVVRCWNKMGALAAAGPDFVVVHLIRSPASWVLSHLLPSGRGTWRKPIGDAWRRATALRRRARYDNWQYETIIDAALARDHPVWRHVNMSRRELSAAPAYVKLLGFWWGANLITATQLAATAPQRHFVLLAEDFMREPDAVIARLSTVSNAVHEPVDTSDVRAGRPERLLDSHQWRQAFKSLGIPRALLPEARPTTTKLAEVLGAPALVRR